MRLATTFMFAVPALAGVGDQHDHNAKTCKNNDDNNCNDKHKTQMIKVKNECEIEDENKDHSKDNSNDNTLYCINEAQNLNDVFKEFVEDGGGRVDS